MEVFPKIVNDFSVQTIFAKKLYQFTKKHPIYPVICKLSHSY